MTVQTFILDSKLYRVCPNIVRAAICYASGVMSEEAETEQIFNVAGVLLKQHRSNIFFRRLDQYKNIYLKLCNDYLGLRTRSHHEQEFN